VIHLDTHVVVWLYAGLHDRIPVGLRGKLEADTLAVSPMVRLELAFLNEIGRLTDSPAQVLEELHRSVGLAVDGTTFADVSAVACTPRLAFTRDPFDRLIAAQAIAARASLATKDASLRENLDLAVWD
jgi:PIN domain nuclease of toxin-antitoxin system